MREYAPDEWNNRWDSMPNSARQLYATISPKSIPWIKKEIKIEGWGQLGNEGAAANMVAYHMHNKKLRGKFNFVSWRCEMNDGTERGGPAPKDFNFDNYGPNAKIKYNYGNYAN